MSNLNSLRHPNFSAPSEKCVPRQSQSSVQATCVSSVGWTQYPAVPNVLYLFCPEQSSRIPESHVVGSPQGVVAAISSFNGSNEGTPDDSFDGSNEGKPEGSLLGS